MKILVTGGAGYIGSHVVKQLCDAKQQHHVVIVDNLSTGFSKTIETLIAYDKKVSFFNIDLVDTEKLEALFIAHTFDTVIHFAASLIVPESVKNPLLYYQNNTANTTNLIRLCIKYNAPKFIFSSTAAVYGEVAPELIPVNEEAPTHPINPYGYSKLFIEQILKDTSLAHPSFKYASLRYFNVAGANIDGLLGQSTLNATHLIKVAAEAALGKRNEVFIFGDDYKTPDGTCIRDYIHVDDLSRAHLFAVEYLETHNSIVFNVGYGKGFSVKDVLETMKRVSHSDFNIKHVGRREGDPAVLISDNGKILKAFETMYGPKASLFQYNDLALICESAYVWEKKYE